MDINIEALVKEKIEDVDVGSLVRSEIRKELSGDIKRSIKEVMRCEIGDIIRTEIDIVMTTLPISTDDGWGKKEEFVSFEELFKKEFYSRLNSSWEMKKEVSKVVKAHVESLFNRHEENINKYVVEKIIGSEEVEQCLT